MTMTSLISLASGTTKASINGTIIDSLSKESLAYVSVYISSVADGTVIKGVITDEKGYFEISKIIAGDYSITIQYMGYKIYKKNYIYKEEYVFRKHNVRGRF